MGLLLDVSAHPTAIKARYEHVRDCTILQRASSMGAPLVRSLRSLPVVAALHFTRPQSLPPLLYDLPLLWGQLQCTETRTRPQDAGLGNMFAPMTLGGSGLLRADHWMLCPQLRPQETSPGHCSRSRHCRRLHHGCLAFPWRTRAGLSRHKAHAAKERRRERSTCTVSQASQAL